MLGGLGAFVPQALAFAGEVIQMRFMANRIVLQAGQQSHLLDVLSFVLLYLRVQLGKPAAERMKVGL